MKDQYDYNVILAKVPESDRKEIKQRLMVLIDSVARTTFTESRGHGRLARIRFDSKGTEIAGGFITNHYKQFFK